MDPSILPVIVAAATYSQIGPSQPPCSVMAAVCMGGSRAGLKPVRYEYDAQRNRYGQAARARPDSTRRVRSNKPPSTRVRPMPRGARFVYIVAPSRLREPVLPRDLIVYFGLLISLLTLDALVHEQTSYRGRLCDTSCVYDVGRLSADVGCVLVFAIAPSHISSA